MKMNTNDAGQTFFPKPSCLTEIVACFTEKQRNDNDEYSA